MKNIWKPVPGYEDTHLISREGEVRSIKRPARRSGMTLKPWSCPLGYKKVAIRGKTFNLHRLVLEAFVRPPQPGEHAAHLDGNPSNNCLHNLAWKSPRENCADTIKHGNLTWGERNGNAKLTEADVRQIRALREKGWKWADIHAKFPQVTRTTVLEAGNGKTFRHIGGFIGTSDRADRVRRERNSSASVSEPCRR